MADQMFLFGSHEPVCSEIILDKSMKDSARTRAKVTQDSQVSAQIGMSPIKISVGPV